MPGVAAKYNLTRTYRAIDICSTYRKVSKEVLPPFVFNTSQVKSYKDATLVLIAENSSCAQLLHMHRHVIMKKLIEKYGAAALTDIKIEIGST